MDKLNIILAAIDERLIDAWQTFFAQENDVTIVQADITKLPCDAMVSPANSFGFMDGGLDYELSERFGWELQTKLQQRIRDLPEGELLVGQAMVMETGDESVPFLISAPTMRIPTNFNIATSVNAYLAMKAILIKANTHAGIASVAVPGLCTGIGGMQPMIAARQMFQAYKEIVLGERVHFKNFGDAQKHHRNINPQGMIWTH